MPLVTFQVGDFFFGFGVLAGEAFGDVLTLLFSGFVALARGECDGDGVGVGVLVSGRFGNGVTVCFGGFVGFATGVAVGVGVLSGDGFGDGVTVTLSAFDFSRVRCFDSCSSVVGNAIAVGSSTAVGRFTGVGAAVGGLVSFGVDAESGSKSLPRLCEIVAEGDG